MMMTADDDNRMLKTSNETGTATFLLLFGV